MKVQSLGGPQGQRWMFLDWDVWADFQALFLFFFFPQDFVESPFPFFIWVPIGAQGQGQGDRSTICLTVWKWKSLSRVWLFDPVDYTVHGILQARILEWLAFPFSRGSSQPRNRTGVSYLAGGFFTSWLWGKPLCLGNHS